MLGILFFILKLIGIILAAIIGIFLILIITILLVPIRYRIDGVKEDDFRFDGKISWLLHLIYCRINYIENQLIIRVRIFGRLFYDSTAPKTKRSRKARKKNKSKQSNRSKVAKNTEKVNKVAEEISENVANEVKDETELFLNNRKEIKREQEIQEKFERKSDNIDVTEDIKNSIQADLPEIDSKNETLFYKWKSIWAKLIRIPKYIKEKIKNIWNRIKLFGSKVSEIKLKWERIKYFYASNKIGIKKIWLSIKKLVKHILPYKFRAEVEFGFEDPAATGQVLGAIAVLYGYYGEKVLVIPNFEKEVLQGEVHCKGRIRLFTLLIICIKLILDKNFRILVKNFNTFKEEL